MLERRMLATRFGYGLPAPEGAAGSMDDVMALLASADVMATRWPIVGQGDLFLMVTEMRGIGREAGTTAQKQAHEDRLKSAINDMLVQSQKLTFARAVDSADGFRERLVAFWADHFSVVGQNFMLKQLPYAMVEDAIRPNLNRSFADLLTAVTLHPAMLVYLDQANSVGPNSKAGEKRDKGLNENLARELLELHTLGVAAQYSQADVTELAKLLTGVTYSPAQGMFFEPKRAEPGAETVLGVTYGGDGLEPVLAALRDLARRPETAVHIARKLMVHFVTDTPDQAQVDAVAQAFSQSGGDLRAVYAALLAQPAARDAQMQKVRQPYDFLVAAARALGLSGDDFAAMELKRFSRAFPGTLAEMGQPLKRPSGPNGFPEAAADWITPMGLARRISWAMRQPRILVRDLPDPVALVQSCLAERAGPALVQAAARAEDRVQGVGLILASAEFNRR